MQENIALVTGADRGLGFALCKELLRRGWRVYAGQFMPDWPQLIQLSEVYPGRLHFVGLDVGSPQSVAAAAHAVSATTDRIDLLVNNAGITFAIPDRLGEPQDYASMLRMYEVNALGPIRVVDAFLPFVARSSMKRLCFVSSEAGCITRSSRKGSYGYCMSKSALNMAVHIMFNDLRPQGYTFRLYHPGWMRTYMMGSRNTEAPLEPEDSAARAVPFFLRKRNEDRLVMVDYDGKAWPW